MIPTQMRCTLFHSALWAMAQLFLVSAAIIERRQATSASSAASASPTPDYFDTPSHGPYPGPTATGQAPFLSEINPVAGSGLPTGTRAYAPNTPLETSEPIVNNTGNINIFSTWDKSDPISPIQVGSALRSILCLPLAILRRYTPCIDSEVGIPRLASMSKHLRGNSRTRQHSTEPVH